MTDVVSGQVRSRMMAGIGARNTRPEIALRRRMHALGFRFRLHRRDLPGTPDLVFPRHRAAVFVHGCFWHRHAGCRKASTPATRTAFWQEKFAANVARDRRVQAELIARGWRVAVVWECALGRGADRAASQLAGWLVAGAERVEIEGPPRPE
ncbi:very short patch repair endonuclease [Salipiger sp.]|uniref:very short patch repair endonuclease n=1 Tax=Salipiger sp. TaxID=2078585 RepID=UPI003A980FD6